MPVYNPSLSHAVVFGGNTQGAMATVSTGTFFMAGGNNITLSQNANSVSFHGVPAQTTQTQASGNIAGAGFTSTTQAGTSIGVTHNSAGLSMAQPPFITTYAAQTTQTQASGNIAGTGYTSTTQAGTSIGVTHNSAGLSLAQPPFITTYAAQTNQTAASGNIAGTGYTSTTQAGSTVGATQNTAGLSMAWPPFITTAPAAQTTQTQASGNIAGAGFTSTTQAGTSIGVTHNSAGLSMAQPAFITTYAAQTNQTAASGNIAGTGYTSTTQAGTTVGVTQNTAGLSMAWPPFLTTAAGVQSTQTQPAGNIAGVGTTFAGTNVSGSMTFNSNGLNLALSAGAGGGGGGGIGIADSANTITTNNVVFANANGVSFGLNGSTMTASFNDPAGWALYGNTLGTSSSTLTNGSMYFQGAGVVTLSGNSNTIIINAPDYNMSLLGNTAGAANLIADNAGTFYLAGGNNLTLSGNGSTFSMNAGGAFSASGGSSSFVTMSFSNSANGVTFSNSQGQLVMSHSLQQLSNTSNITANAVNTSVSASFQNTTATSNITSNAQHTSNMAWSLAGNSLGANAVTHGTRPIVFAGGNNITLSGNGSTITIVGPTAGNISQTGPNFADGNGVTVTSGTVVFSNSNGVSFGLAAGAGGGTITASAAGGGGGTVSFMEPNQLHAGTSYSSFGQNTLNFIPVKPNVAVAMTAVKMLAYLTATSSALASGAVSQTISYAWYSLGTGTNNTRIELMGSSSIAYIASQNSNVSQGWTYSQGTNSTTFASAGVGSTSAQTGQRIFAMPFTTTLTVGGEYYFAIAQSTTSVGNTNANRISHLVLSQMTQNASRDWGYFGGSNAASFNVTSAGSNIVPFNGFMYSATSNAWPSTIALSQRSNMSNIRPYIQLDA